MNEAVLERFTRQYIHAQKVPEVVFGWQGGEPTLMGVDFFRKAVAIQKKVAKPGIKVLNAFQTNGTLINDEWAQFFHDNDFLVGISIDGPRDLHDAYRVTPKGAGSFSKVKNGLQLLKKHDVEFNILACVHAGNENHPLKVYRCFRDDLGAKFIQFIPIIERKRPDGLHEIEEATDRSVSGAQYGHFLNAIFDEWVRKDVGDMFVQIFDITLGAFVGQAGALCVFAKTCGNALALEHNGDLFACDHFVQEDQYRGNIMKTPLQTLVASKDQFQFGLDKQEKLPKYCLTCPVLFACNGGCPKNRIATTPDGEKGLNHLCEGYKLFFTHVTPYMRFMANQLAQRQPPANIMHYLDEHGNLE